MEKAKRYLSAHLMVVRMHSTKTSPKANAILGQIPKQEYDLIQRNLKPVSLKVKEELNGVGGIVRALYFPVDAVISLMDMQPSGRTVEVAVVGKEGCTYSHYLAGAHTSLARTVVQVGGGAYRLPVSTLPKLLPRIPCFVRMTTRFSAVSFRHAVLSVGCSQHHSVEQRMARWLLAHWKRTGHFSFAFTHDFLAEQVGALRVTVTDALSKFERMGIISSGYGKVELQDVEKMRTISCGCFPLAMQAIEEYLEDIKSYASEVDRI